MMSTVLLLIGAGSAFLGCGYLALSQTKHCKVILGRDDTPARKRFYRWVGWTLIAAGYAPCAMRDGAGFAVLLWPLLIAAATLSVAMIIAYRPTWLRFLRALPVPRQMQSLGK